MTMHRGPRAALRAADVVVVVVLAPIWLVMFLLCALAVAVMSGRPVFFRQERVGRGEQPFSMIKFRSMATGENSLVPDPQAITPIGVVLRRTSLDELPQLFNVLRGDMSLVGPRPMLVEQLDRLTLDQRCRHEVRPGLTGLAQISGRNGLTWSERIRLDRAWVADPSLGRYAMICLLTVGVVLSGSGVTGHSESDPIASGSAV